ncbi:MAG: YihY family inner membrane protein [Arenicellales bacterium]|nr:YihY family inner membrane protein [Arenicellales bacterium]MDP6551801.1 YihY family inner membrane protein [Arenicellales bacterium]
MSTANTPSSSTRQMLHRIVTRVKKSRLPSVASALAFTTVLALVPLLTVVFAILSMFPFFFEWRDEIETFLYNNLVPATGDVVKTYLQDFAGQAGTLTGLGLAALLVTALLLLSTIEDAFNNIWNIQRGRTVSQRLLLYWAMLTLGPVLMVTSLALTTYLGSSVLSAWIPAGHGVAAAALKVLPVFLEGVGFFLMYLIVPSCTVRLRSAVGGAVVALALFELTKFGFAIFIANFNTYQIIYGAMWSIPVFLLWIYLSWLVTLLGGCISAEMDASAKTPASLPRVPPVMKKSPGERGIRSGRNHPQG